MEKWPKTQQKCHTTNGSFQKGHCSAYTLTTLDMWLIIHSKWPTVIPIKDISAENTIEILLDRFTTHGLCEQISDNESRFTLEILKRFCEASIPYHPQSNGEAERFVQTFKTTMMKSKLSGEKMKPSLSQVQSHCSLYLLVLHHMNY